MSDGSTQDVTSTATWKSLNPSVASVSAGAVSALAQGTSVVTATSGSASGSASVTVSAAPALDKPSPVPGTPPPSAPAAPDAVAPAPDQDAPGAPSEATYQPSGGGDSGDDGGGGDSGDGGQGGDVDGVGDDPGVSGATIVPVVRGAATVHVRLGVVPSRVPIRNSATYDSVVKGLLSAPLPHSASPAPGRLPVATFSSYAAYKMAHAAWAKAYASKGVGGFIRGSPRTSRSIWRSRTSISGGGQSLRFGATRLRGLVCGNSSCRLRRVRRLRLRPTRALGLDRSRPRSDRRAL